MAVVRIWLGCSKFKRRNEDLTLILSLERFSKFRNDQNHSTVVKKLVKLNVLSVTNYPCVYFAQQNSKLRARNKELEGARQQKHQVRIQVVLTNLCRLFYVIPVFPFRPAKRTPNQSTFVEQRLQHFDLTFFASTNAELCVIGSTCCQKQLI